MLFLHLPLASINSYLYDGTPEHQRLPPDRGLFPVLLVLDLSAEVKKALDCPKSLP